MARSSAMRSMIIRVLSTAVALWIATVLIDGIQLTTDQIGEKALTLIIVAAIFGLVNGVLRPIVRLFTIAFYLLTLGLFALIVNGLLFLLVSWFAGALDLPFHVDNFWPSAVLGALLVGVVSWFINWFVKD